MDRNTFIFPIFPKTVHRVREHVKKCIFADASAKGEGEVDPPPLKMHFFLFKLKNAYNVLKQKNMQNYFVKCLQGYPLKTWKFFPNIFNLFH